MAKWVAAFILLMFATGSSFPIYFPDQVFRSLDQLDEALANGEISQEYYDEVAALFAGEYTLDQNSTDDISDGVLDLQSDHQRFLDSTIYLQYNSMIHQRLEQPYQFLRYDRAIVRSNQFELRFITEHTNGASLRVRSRSLSIYDKTSGRWSLQLGNFNYAPGCGLTFGKQAPPTLLQAQTSGLRSVLYPRRGSGNGLLFNYRTRDPWIEITGFASRNEGERFSNTSLGGVIQLVHTSQPGIVVMSQRIVNSDAGASSKYYIAPFFGYDAFKLIAARGESSFQIGGPSAHFYQLDIGRFRRKIRLSIAGFSYAKNYKNIQSNGYAFSDNEDVTIDEVGMEYRDKRPGRIGVLVEQEIGLHTKKLSAQLVRWQNRLDDRQCVAARLTLEDSKRIGILYNFRLQVIHQDLDIIHDTDTRNLIALSTELLSSKSFTYENQHKIEQRALGSTKKYPFRSRHDFSLKINPQLELIAMANFYDSDLNTSGNSQLTLAIGEELQASRDFRFSTRLQTRYKFSTEQLDNWELRISLEMVL